MGSFSQSCLISRLPIREGDRCYVLPIIKNPMFGYLNDSFAALYKPLFLPIEGAYNDYGDITSITHNAHTDWLEAFYTKDIESIAGCISCSRKMGDRDVEYTGHGTLMEHFGPKLKDWDLSPKSLETMGFKVVDGYVTHDWVEAAATQLAKRPEYSPKGAVANWRFKLVKHKRDYRPYEIDVEDGGQKRERGIDDIEALCQEMTRYVKTLSHGGRRYLFGVGEYGSEADSQKRERLWYLQDSTRAFIKTEVYDQFAAQGLKELKADKYDSERLTETLETLTEALKSHEAPKGDKTERPFSAFRDREIWERGLTALFHDAERTYGTDLPTFATKLTDLFVTFRGFEHSLIMNNVMLYPNQSFQQYSSPSEQKPYHQIVGRAFRADVKAYNAWANR